MDYVRKADGVVIERYTVNSYRVDFSERVVSVSITHIWMDEVQDLKEEHFTCQLDNTAGRGIDPSFTPTTENIAALFPAGFPESFDQADPTTWSTVTSVLPYIDIPEKKYFDLVTAASAADMPTAILQKLVDKGTLPNGTVWEYE